MKSVLSIQSHVVYGHAGNSSMVFPMQRMGIDVSPIYTAHCSNSSHYEQGVARNPISADNIRQLIHGLDNIKQLCQFDAVISGYLSTTDQCHAVAETVNKVKLLNPNAMYVYEPEMLDTEGQCDDLKARAKECSFKLLTIADVFVPSQYELAQCVGMKINSLYDVITACKKALDYGPKLVLVKHVHTLSDGQFTSLLATRKGCYVLQRPYLEFAIPPSGAGELTTAVFTASLINQLSPVEAFKHAANAVYGVLEVTRESNARELEIINAQYEMVEPTHNFIPKRLA